MGDREMLEKFATLNPALNRDNLFVDDYNFRAYNALGLGSFTDSNNSGIPPLRIPDLGGVQEWWKYVSNVLSLSPIDKEKRGGIPEGVLRLGGTFVVQGEDVVYQWNDKIPGDYPEIKNVLEFLKQRAETAQRT